MSTRRSVAVRIRGQEFRILTDRDPDFLSRVAGLVDQTMARIERHTGTVDSFDLAMLTALNLARELLEIREKGSGGSADVDRLRSLLERVESSLVA